jgi:hypothetical protein
MRRHKVQSSALQSIGYDAKKQVLELEFRDNRSVWQYFGIRPSTYRKFISAESLGNYFIKRIKGRYPQLKLI